MQTTSSSPTSRAAAFTLVELLVVITIIIILAGLLFPAFGAVQERAKKVQALNDAQGIVNAVKNYYTEYGRYPLPTAAGGVVQDYVFKPNGSNTNGGIEFTNDRIVNVLRGHPTNDQGVDGGTGSTSYDLNPRQIVFLEAKDAKDKANPKAGISPTGSTTAGQWVDPWGTPYVVFIDADYDNNISSTVFKSIYVNTPNALVPQTAVAVASYGKDLAPGNKTGGTAPNVTGDGDCSKSSCDDVLSWR